MQLADLCELIVDCEHKTAPTQQSGYPSIRTPNIGRGFFLLDGVNRVSDETYRLWTRRAVPQAGDLIMAREAPVGNVAMIPEGLTPCLGQRTLLIRPDKSKVEPRYLTYLLIGDVIQGRIRGMTSGATVPHLNMKDVRSLVLPPIPPLSVQQRIASVLSAYDDLIENNLRRIKVITEMARSLYREWLVEFRYPGGEGRRLVPSELGAIPHGWSVLPLEEVCERITDGAHHSPPSVDEGYPMASVKDMRDWGFDISGCRKISEEDYVQLVRNDCRPRKNDVLIAKDGSYLKHTFVVDEEQDLVILSSIAILRPNSRIRSNVLNFLLQDKATSARMSGFVSGVAIPRIVLKDFRRFRIVVPSIEIQDMWCKAVDSMTALCKRLVIQNTNLRNTRDLLLPRLLSGQLAVDSTDVAI